MSKKTKVLLEANKELIDTMSPAEWIDFLFELQSDLIFYNHFEAMGEKDRTNYVNAFYALKQHFKTISTINDN